MLFEKFIIQHLWNIKILFKRCLSLINIGIGVNRCKKVLIRKYQALKDDADLGSIEALELVFKLEDKDCLLGNALFDFFEIDELLLEVLIWKICFATWKLQIVNIVSKLLDH